MRYYETNSSDPTEFPPGSWCHDSLGGRTRARQPRSAPFQQLYKLILTHLPGLTEADLNRVAVSGLLSQLGNRVILVSNAPPTALRSYRLPLDKTAVFDRAFAYLRIKNFQSGLAASFVRAFDEMRSANKLNGLIVDLRFAGGSDYAEAAAVGDLFFPREQPLLKWGGSSRRSTVKTNSINLPVTVLVNHVRQERRKLGGPPAGGGDWPDRRRPYGGTRPSV